VGAVGLSSRHRAAIELMERFATSTGVASAGPPRRYLWTDAFAVCNYLGLHVATGQSRYRRLALDLVTRVHDVLGRHRADDPRSGWISGLTEEEGRLHPTACGLRIGKPRPERRPEEPYDPAAEWDRDGQYFHYLTRWMHALHRVWQVTRDEVYHGWAVELARVAAHRFSSGAVGNGRLYWKMSIDLSRPLVASSGVHDPLDGFVTVSGLAADAPAPARTTAERLAPSLGSLARMCRARTWITDDPLGAGSLLVDAYRSVRWEQGQPGLREILPSLLNDALKSMEVVANSGVWRQSAERRLAFRELGFSIGIRAAQRLVGGYAAPGTALEHLELGPLQDELQAFAPYEALAGEIERFWMDPGHRRAAGWSAHREISRVMLATSLGPEGYLGP